MKYELMIARRLKLSEGQERTSSPSLTVAVIGMVLAIVIMILAITIVTGFKQEISDKIYSIDSHIKVGSSGYSLDADYNCVDERDIIPLLQGMPVNDSVANMSLIAEKPAIFKTADDFKGVIYKGCGPDYDWQYLADCLTEGRLPDMNEDGNPWEVIISRLMASQLQLHVGDRIYTYFIDDKIKVRRMTVVGIFSTDFEEYDGAFAIGNLKAVQNVNGWNCHTGNYVGINIKHTDQIEDGAYSIFSTLYANRTDNHGRPLYNVTETHGNNVAYFSWLGLLDMNVVIIIILMAIVSAFTLISALLMIVLERINMIGLLKTLGACNSSIRRIFIYLTQKLIFKALVIGNAVSLGLALLQQHFHIVKLDAESYYIPYVPVEIDWLTIILLNIAIIIVSYLTLIIPSLVISSIKPSRSINFE